MASGCLSSSLSSPFLSPTSSSSPSTTSTTSRIRTSLPFLTRRQRRLQVICMAPEEEKMTRRSPLDFPIEWERPKPGRRPDIFPQFSPMKTPLPPPLPADPPEEDEEDEEKKEEEEEEEDPDKEEPDKPGQQSTVMTIQDWLVHRGVF